MRQLFPDILKRAADVVLSLLGLVCLSPVMVAVGIVARVRLGSPVLFKQTRLGLKAAPFLLFKFRTMDNARDSGGQLLSDGDRLTSLGRFLRSHSLDELPQLWNVLRGEMSLIGPRPLLPKYVSRYTARQRHRHDVRPGITGWAQVSGRNALSWEQKLEMDVWYVDHWSIRLDLKILWLTILAVARREGVSSVGHATMPEFTGGGQ
jgi:sugar transferase EpsL